MCVDFLKNWRAQRLDVYCGIMKRDDKQVILKRTQRKKQQQKQKTSESPSNKNEFQKKHQVQTARELLWLEEELGSGKDAQTGNKSKQKQTLCAKRLSTRRLFENPDNRKWHHNPILHRRSARGPSKNGFRERFGKKHENIIQFQSENERLC